MSTAPEDPFPANPEQLTGTPTGGTRADYESTPVSRAEYIAALVHLYRGELFRSNAWRLRLDNTTNWAVLTTAGLITFTFGEGAHTHWTLLIGMTMVGVFLVFEARRFRYADVWRSRVRMIEENFYGPILRRDPRSPEKDWGRLVARDLFDPRFTITRMQALRARFVRNYWALFVVIISAWSVRILTYPTPAQEWSQIRERLSTGFLLPWWMPLLYVGCILTGIILLVTCTDSIPDPLATLRDSDARTDRKRMLDL